ncbi:hypothetical protein RvY_06950-2 [Ramazzottius varieornatus]|uniref:Uncharacterized protein n=1 Tax=Ramazzottius varieornatus TaxID=947166 RepID=A0A1D1V5L5_RAMVA|nr:hypothetical protein RvY_06950-2 [Ramazzottius varieornatus]
MGDTYGENPRSFGIASFSSWLDFNLLCRALDPTESEATLWHKIIDRKSHLVLFYQIDHQSIKPKLSRCVRLTKDQIHGVREVLKPTVYLHDYEQPSSFVESIFGRNHVSSLDELTEILKVVVCLDLSHLGGTNNVDLSVSA